MVAAPTASLPEAIGGDRNYDYRFAWIRDIAYVIESLSMLGYKGESIKFLYDVMERVKTDGNLKTDNATSYKLFVFNCDYCVDDFDPSGKFKIRPQ